MLQQACCLLLPCAMPEVPAYDLKVTVTPRDRGQRKGWADASPAQPARAETLMWGVAAGREGALMPRCAPNPWIKAP